MKKLFLILSLIVLVVSCKGKTASKRTNEIGDNNNGVVSYPERPSDFYEDYEKAGDLLAKNKIPEAIKAYEELLNKESKKDLAYTGLGACYNLSNNCPLAIIYYKKALAIDSNCISALVGIGSAYYALEIFDTAIMYYNKAKVKNNKIAEAYWGLAITYDRMGNIKKAKENARRFIELAPESVYRDQVEPILKK
jgi:tetratricopeptide (TPR) repeat protein